MSEEATVVITGASAGIGLAIAERYVSLGYRVIGLARRRCPIDLVENLLVDLSDLAKVRTVLGELLPRLPQRGRIHMVHNAAAMPHDAAVDVDPATLERSLRLHVVTPALLDAELIPHMARGSSIVFVGSTLSEKAVPGRLSYVTSKHALLGLMRATVQDLFGKGIHAVCVAPGFVDTPMLRPVLQKDPAIERAMLEMVSYGRLLEPEEIAELVEFAARTPALNGAIVHANLGQRER